MVDDLPLPLNQTDAAIHLAPMTEFITDLSRLIVQLFAVWLIGVAGLCLLRPGLALKALEAMGSTPFIHFGEHALRALVGLALIGVADATTWPQAFFWAGVFIVGSSALIAIAPRRWHHAYAKFWARHLPPWSLQAMAPFTVVAGGALAWAVS
jgi:hypothetical membrane protein